MKIIKESLKSRQEQLLEWKKHLENALAKAPGGTLRVCQHENRTQYYHRTNSHDLNGVYIPQKDKLLAQSLAQKDYNKKLLSVVEKEIAAIQKFLVHYPQPNAEEIYERLHSGRQKLITPLYETDEQFIKNWNSLTYEGKPFSENIPELYTSKGERVRSKSEIIIADFLNKEGIPYRYEYPLYLYGIGKIYPDFTTLNTHTRKEIYESKNNPINQKLLQKIIDKYFF